MAKDINNKNLLYFIGVVGLLFLLKHFKIIDFFEAVAPAPQVVMAPASMEPEEPSLAQGTLSEEEPQASATELNDLVESRPQLVADDLLPKYDEANEFAEQNPVSKLLKEQNFLISGYHVGTNTVMQSTKIPYHDLRSAPPIPREDVGPWSQSSYETFSGAMQRKLE